MGCRASRSNKTTLVLAPLVANRSALAKELVGYMTLLGLERRAAPMKSLEAAFAELEPDMPEPSRAPGEDDDAPRVPFVNLVVIAGRGSGKDSRLAVPITLFEALFGGHEPRTIGEQPGTCVVIAQNERAAKGVAFQR